MHRIFGYSSGAAKPPPAAAPSLDDAQQTLDKRIAYIEEKIRKLDADIIKQRDAMQKMRPGAAQNAAKKRALQALKQKKMYEAQRDQMIQQSWTLEQTAFTTNTLKDTMIQVEALKSAKATLDSQFKNISVDTVSDLQDELEDLFDTSSAIQDALSRQYDMPDGIDEDELEAELLSLEAEMVEEEADDLPSYLLQASVPTHDPGSKVTSQPSYASNTPNLALRDQ